MWLFRDDAATVGCSAAGPRLHDRVLTPDELCASHAFTVCTRRRQRAIGPQSSRSIKPGLPLSASPLSVAVVLAASRSQFCAYCACFLCAPLNNDHADPLLLLLPRVSPVVRWQIDRHHDSNSGSSSSMTNSTTGCHSTSKLAAGACEA